MLNKDARLAELKEAIRTTAFVTSNEQKIISVDEVSKNPWLFDFRSLLLQPKWLKLYAELFWDAFADQYPFQVCGMESAAISLVTAVVLEGLARGTPVNGLFVRKSRKRAGLLKQLEGTPSSDPVILLDDLANSGRTFEKQKKILEQEGLRTAGLFTLLTFVDPSVYETHFDVPMRTYFSLSDFGLSIKTSKKTHAELAPVWRFAAPDPGLNHVVEKSAPVLDRERVYFGTDSGVFFALNQSDGSVAWSFKTGAHPDGKGIFSTPAIHNGVIFFGAYDGTVYALNARTGARVWAYDEADWVGSSPSVAPDLGLLFIGLEFGLWRKRGGIVALDLRTGTKKWEHRTAEFTHGTPLYIKQKNLVVIGSNDSFVYGYAADSGKLQWRYSVRGSVKSSFVYNEKHDLIFFGTLGGAMYALTPEGTPVFAKDLYGGMFSTPLVLGDTIFFASLDKQLHALDMEGQERWAFETNGRIFASPMLADGAIYVGSNDGRLYAVDPQSGKGGAVFQAPERIVNAVAYNETTHHFFVPTHANELYCLMKTEKDKG